MAKVVKVAALLPDLNAAKPQPAPVRINHGVLRTSCFVAAIENGDSVDSTYEVARIPSHARISKLSKFHSAGVAGVNNADLGVAEAPACLTDGSDLSATATVDAASEITVDQIDQPLWQLAGLTKDPQTEMPVFLTLKAAATATGNVAVDLVYITE